MSKKAAIGQAPDFDAVADLLEPAPTPRPTSTRTTRTRTRRQHREGGRPGAKPPAAGHVRTSLDFEADLYERAKIAAIRRRSTLRALVSEALTGWLEREGE